MNGSQYMSKSRWRTNLTQKEEAVTASNEDECLGDHGDLQVDDHVHLIEIGLLVWGDAKSVLEEVGVDNDDEENDGGKGLVETICLYDQVSKCCVMSNRKKSHNSLYKKNSTTDVAIPKTEI